MKLKGFELGLCRREWAPSENWWFYSCGEIMPRGGGEGGFGSAKSVGLTESPNKQTNLWFIFKMIVWSKAINERNVAARQL